tara:strand:- start:910 stop:1377 length:468 start_codon:yes stop_codon:yes gene_type:complete
MRLILVKLEKLKNNLYIKIPEIIQGSLNLKEGENIEISIHSDVSYAQGELWEYDNNDISEIIIDISEDLHTINMYNRIYIPEKFRFFFPKVGLDFIIETNAGNISTHITSNGYFSKGMRSWFHNNGPLYHKDQLIIRVLDEKKSIYSMELVNSKK